MDAGVFLHGVAVLVSDGLSRRLYRRDLRLAMDGFAAAAMRNNEVTERAHCTANENPGRVGDRGFKNQMS
ncbi:hypothetical protein [Tardiphaga sp.]|jgi:hypothetical protein|uniref:hypothetical protein n=1 Tax=Tardiphaga sp. TaxID=1926292 RepID=UPI0037D9933E